jgi:aminoacyl tRNA synthase complex-interacting multifunctional protein 1
MKGKVIVMANLKPRPLAGFVSNGMVVCASNDDHTIVELLIPEGELGERVFL